MIKSDSKIKAAAVAGNRFAQLLAGLTPIEAAKAVQDLTNRGEKIKGSGSRKFWLLALVNTLTQTLLTYAEMMNNELQRSDRGPGTDNSPKGPGSA